VFNVFPKLKTLGKNKDKFYNFVNAMIPFKFVLGTNGDHHYVSHVCFVFSLKKDWPKFFLQKTHRTTLLWKKTTTKKENKSTTLASYTYQQ